MNDSRWIAVSMLTTLGITRRAASLKSNGAPSISMPAGMIDPKPSRTLTVADSRSSLRSSQRAAKTPPKTAMNSSAAVRNGTVLDTTIVYTHLALPRVSTCQKVKSA